MWRIPHGVKLEQMKGPSLEKPIVTLAESAKKQEQSLFKLPERKNSAPMIISAVKQAGVIDETDGKSLYGKLLIFKEKKTELLAACCFDDDPYTSSSEAVFKENRKKVLSGLGYAAKACGAKGTAAIVGRSGISGNVIGAGKVKIIEAPGRYPAIAIAKQKLGLGERLGIIGAQACAAVYDAVKNRKPQSDTVVTVAGDGASRWVNCRVKIGTPIKEVLDGLHGNYRHTVAAGSSITGRMVEDLSEPVKADTRLLLVLKKERAKNVFPCIGCGKCKNACTQGIVPWAVFKEVESAKVDFLRLPNVQRCIGCAACNVVCPSGIDLLSAVKKAAEIKKSGDIYATV